MLSKYKKGAYGSKTQQCLGRDFYSLLPPSAECLPPALLLTPQDVPDGAGSVSTYQVQNEENKAGNGSNSF